MNYTLTLGKKIKDFRILCRKSQLEVELEIGASTGVLSRIETNKINPTKETILAIAKALNLTPNETASLFNIYFK